MTGIFTKLPKAPVKSKKDKPTDFLKISEEQQMHKIKGVWFIVDVVAYPKEYDSDMPYVNDILLGKKIRDFYTYETVIYLPASNSKTSYKHHSESHLWKKKYGGNYYGVAKHSANSKEIKKYIG